MRHLPKLCAGASLQALNGRACKRLLSVFLDSYLSYVKLNNQILLADICSSRFQEVDLEEGDFHTVLAIMSNYPGEERVLTLYVSLEIAGVDMY